MEPLKVFKTQTGLFRIGWTDMTDFNATHFHGAFGEYKTASGAEGAIKKFRTRYPHKTSR